MKLITNYHTHSKYCSHGSGEIIDYVKRAIEEGLTEIGFSEHAYNKYLKFPFAMTENQEEYFLMIKEAKNIYNNSISIYAGLEVDFFEECIDYYKELLKDFDYLGMSLHFYNFEFPYAKQKEFTSFNLDNYEKIEKYTNLAIKGMETKLFKVFFHPDYFIGKDTPICAKYIERIVDCAIKNKVFLELNCAQFLNHYGYKIDEGRYAFWQIVSKKKAKVIINTDAHHPDSLVPACINQVFEFSEKLNLSVVPSIWSKYDS